MDNLSFGVGLVIGAAIGVLVGALLKDIICNKLTSITRDDSGRIIEVLETHT